MDKDVMNLLFKIYDGEIMVEEEICNPSEEWWEQRKGVVYGIWKHFDDDAPSIYRTYKPEDMANKLKGYKSVSKEGKMFFEVIYNYSGDHVFVQLMIPSEII